MEQLVVEGGGRGEGLGDPLLLLGMELTLGQDGALITLGGD